MTLFGWTLVRAVTLANLRRDRAQAIAAFEAWRDACVDAKNRLQRAGLLTDEEAIARGVPLATQEEGDGV